MNITKKKETATVSGTNYNNKFTANQESFKSTCNLIESETMPDEIDVLEHKRKRFFSTSCNRIFD